MIRKPDDITQEEFEAMIEAMLAWREALRDFVNLPHMSARSEPYKAALARSSQAREHLTGLFGNIDDDDDSEAA